MTKDQVVLDIVSKYIGRSEVGVAKYGTTLQENNTDNFFKHLQEELMDASLYVEKLMAIVRDTPNDADLGAEIRKMFKL